MRRGQLAPGEIKIGIARDRLIEHLDRVQQFILDLRAGDTRDQSLAPDIQAIGGEVLGRSLVNRSSLAGGDAGLKLSRNLLHDLALHSENVVQLTFVAHLPQPGFLARVGELEVDPHRCTSATNVAFQNVAGAEALRDDAQIARSTGKIAGDGGATDHPQIRDLGERSENRILHRPGEQGILFRRPQILKWKHRDAALRKRSHISRLGRGGRNDFRGQPAGKNP